MTKDIKLYNKSLPPEKARICTFLAEEIDHALPEAKGKIWHRHPVWFLDDNPVVGYSKLKKVSGCCFGVGRALRKSALYQEQGNLWMHIYICQLH